MDDTYFEQTAKKAESELGKLYITVSAVALCVSIGLCAVILGRAGISSFSILQAIGCILLILVVCSGILYFKKNRIRENTRAVIISEGEAPDTQSFLSYLEAHMTSFELTYQLFRTKKSK